MKRNIYFIFAGILIASLGWGIFSLTWEKPGMSLYSTQPQGQFPGLKVYDSDFLIPLNRLELTEHVLVDDPDERYGSSEAPFTAMLFRIREPDQCQYFMISGPQWRNLREIKYLGADIDIRQVKEADTDIGRELHMDSRLANIEPPDSRYFDKVAPWEFVASLKKAIRENDKAAVAAMIRYPVNIDSWRYHTRREVIDDYDKIFDSRRKNAILNATFENEDIWFSWRGMTISGRLWCADATPGEAGPITAIVR